MLLLLDEMLVRDLVVLEEVEAVQIAVFPGSVCSPVLAQVGDVKEETVCGVGGGFCGEGEEVGGGAVGGDADAGGGNGWRSWGGCSAFQPRRDQIGASIVGVGW